MKIVGLFDALCCHAQTLLGRLIQGSIGLDLIVQELLDLLYQLLELASTLIALCHYVLNLINFKFNKQLLPSLD